MDATQFLRRQQRAVESLFGEIRRTADPGERRVLLGAITDTLGLHMKLEERILYPAVQKTMAETSILDALDSHYLAKVIIAWIPKLDPADERFPAKMTVFEELVRHHADEEEEIFKAAQDLGEAELRALGERMAVVVKATRDAPDAVTILHLDPELRRRPLDGEKVWASRSGVGRASHAEAEEGHASKWERPEGDQPETGDRNRPFGSAEERRQGPP